MTLQKNQRIAETLLETPPDVLRVVGKLFSERDSETVSREELAACLGEKMPRYWTSAQDGLEGVFRYVWAQVCARASCVLQDETDPRNALTRAFRGVFEVFLEDEPVLGRCIILESHRYETSKIRRMFLVPEVTQFLELVRSYIRRQSERGLLLSINPDALIELLLSVQDGMMFIWAVRDELGYSSRFSVDEFGSILRMLVSSLAIPANQSSKLYYDAVGESYDDLYTDGISLAENSLVGDLLAENVAHGTAVLDLGCGSGLGYELLSDKDRLGTRFSYHGVDISVGMIKEARRKFVVTENARFDVMNMEDLSYFENESFDSVISLFGSFSHAIRNDQAVREIKRVLRPRGTFLIMTYSRMSLRNLLKCIRNLSLTPISEVHGYEIRKTSGSVFAEARFYTHRSLRSLFSGFQNVRVRGLNAMLELPVIRSLYGRPDRWISTKAYLRREMRVLNPFLGFAHSLITSGERP